jgi:hypothetical protein
MCHALLLSENIKYTVTYVFGRQNYFVISQIEGRGFDSRWGQWVPSIYLSLLQKSVPATFLEG